MIEIAFNTDFSSNTTTYSPNTNGKSKGASLANRRVKLGSIRFQRSHIMHGQVVLQKS